MRKADEAAAKDASRFAADYLGKLPDVQRTALEDLRISIRQAAPDAEEAVSYGMPAFKLYGRPLVAYAAFKNHLSLFPMGTAAIDAFREELRDFEVSSGTIRFTPERPLPKDLLQKIVRYRVDAVRSKVKQPKKS